VVSSSTRTAGAANTAAKPLHITLLKAVLTRLLRGASTWRFHLRHVRMKSSTKRAAAKAPAAVEGKDSGVRRQAGEGLVA